MKIYIQRRQEKCNFCLQWFIQESKLNATLNVCSKCLRKSLFTNQYKIAEGCGDIYQMYMGKINYNTDERYYNANTNILLSEIDELQQLEIQQVINKWSKISNNIKNKGQIQNDLFEILSGMFVENKQQYTKYTEQFIQKVKDQLCGKTTPLKDLSLSQLNINYHSQTQRNITVSEFALQQSFNMDDLNLGTLSARKQSLKTSKENKRSCFVKKNIKNLLATDRSMKSTTTVKDKQQTILQTKKSQFSHKVKKIRSNIVNFLDNQKQHKPMTTLRVMKQKICQAVLNTNIQDRIIQLVSFNLQNISIQCYLSMFKWDSIEVVKLVKVGLRDQDVKELAQFLSDKKVQTLVLTNNSLTEQSIKHLMNIDIPSLQNVYLAKNQIFGSKLKEQIKQLKQKYMIYL